MWFKIFEKLTLAPLILISVYTQADQVDHTTYFKIQTQDGVELDAAIDMPLKKIESKLPVVLILQGGGPINVDGLFASPQFPPEHCKKTLPDSREIDICRLDLNTSRSLTSSGFAVVRLGKRGTTLSLENPNKYIADNKVHRTSTLSNRIADTLILIDQLKNNDSLDISKLYIYGISEGTMLASLVAERLKDLVKAMVLVGPVLDSYEFISKYQGVTIQFNHLLESFDLNKDEIITKNEWIQENISVPPPSYRFGEQSFNYTIERYARIDKSVTFNLFDEDNSDSIDRNEFENVINRDLQSLYNEAIKNIDQKLFEKTQGIDTAGSAKMFKELFDFGRNADRLVKFNIPIKVIVGELDIRTPKIQLDFFKNLIESKGKTNISYCEIKYEGHNSGIHSKEAVKFLSSLIKQQ